MDESVAEVARERNQCSCCEIPLSLGAISEENDVARAEGECLF